MAMNMGLLREMQQEIREEKERILRMERTIDRMIREEAQKKGRA